MSDLLRVVIVVVMLGAAVVGLRHLVSGVMSTLTGVLVLVVLGWLAVSVLGVDVPGLLAQFHLPPLPTMPWAS
ncbi:hypothetical protein [Pengzhenrongella sp.]|jgi:hypothetical protein|uniref:hypothetical protein n=1 Tax=Pengzhenrongella sp. TaxID=2888820 RepID=UPI002F958AA9